MAVTQICCPHCEKEIFLYTTVQGTALPKGPKPYDYGIEIDDFIIEKVEGPFTLPQVGRMLETRGITPPKGGEWFPASVQRVYKLALKRRQERNKQGE